MRSSASRRKAAPRKKSAAGRSGGASAGIPSSTKTVNWAADQFRKAGIADVTHPADRAGSQRVVLDAALLGSEAARGSLVRARQPRRGARIRDAAVALQPAVRNADRAARVRQRRQFVGPAAHRRQGQDRRAADRAAGPHGVRAGRRRGAVAGAAQARRRGRVQPRAAAWQRARARLQQLRQPLLQHRRPRRPLPRERPRPRGSGRRGRQGPRPDQPQDRDAYRGSRPRTPSPSSRAGATRC